MTLRTLFTVALLVLGSTSSALCSTLQVTASGVFGDDLFARISPNQTPGGTFSYSFLIDSTPSVRAAVPGLYSDLQIQDLQYTLNGNKVTTNSDAYVTLPTYNNALYLYFTGGPFYDRLNLTPDEQLYSGGVEAPTILPGSYAVGYGDFNGPNNPLASVSNINITTVGGVAVTPEPSSLLLLSTGVLGVAGVLRRKLA